MEGATASNETLGGVGGLTAAVARRRMALIALAVVVAFGAAFAIGVGNQEAHRSANGLSARAELQMSRGHTLSRSPP